MTGFRFHPPQDYLGVKTPHRKSCSFASDIATVRLVYIATIAENVSARIAFPRATDVMT